MRGLAALILDFWYGPANAVIMPYQKTVDAPLPLVDVEEEDDGWEDGTWGKSTKRLKFTKHEGGAEFDLGDGKNRLKMVQLDEYDMEVLQEYNRGKDKKRHITPAHMIKVKRYLVNQKEKYSYKEIAQLINMSQSYVQKIGPRVKDAMRLRAAANPSPRQK